MNRATVLPRATGAVQLGGPTTSWAGLSSPSSWDHPTVFGDDTASEVRGIQLDTPCGFIHGAQFRQREGRPDESCRDAGDFEFNAHTINRVAHDL